MTPSRWCIRSVLLLCLVLGHEVVFLTESRSMAIADVTQAVEGTGFPHIQQLFFISNRGQLDRQVEYYMHAGDRVFYFTSLSVTIVLKEPRGSSLYRLQPAAAIERRDKGQYWAAQLEFVGANQGVVPRGGRPVPTRISYFKGPPEQWQSAIPTYGKLVYERLWPGVDLVFTANKNQLKYTFVVHPGADPKQIQLAYRGAKINATRHGQLKVETPFGGFVDQAPVAWQETDNGRRYVPCTYNVADTDNSDIRRYGFSVKAYDATLPLVLDPGFTVYSGLIGGSDDEAGRGIAVDAAGNAYVTGETESADFPRTVGLAHAGSDDVFVAKVRPDGAALVYSVFIGGSADDTGYSIAVDAAGNAYVTGETYSADFPRTVGLAHAGSADVFVAKVRHDGTALVYSGFIGGSDDEAGHGIAVDAAGNAYVTGKTYSADFPRTVGLAHAGQDDAFVAKVRPDGESLVYSGLIGGSAYDNGYSIAVDAAGNAYVTGETLSDDFPRTVGLAHAGSRDVFVAKVRPDGAALVYSGLLGGSANDRGFGIAVDTAGNAYVTGYTSSADFPRTVGLAHAGKDDVFVAKVRPDGAALVYSVFIGGSADDNGYSIAVDAGGNAYVTGETESADFPLTVGLSHAGQDDAFVAKVRPDGESLVYSGLLGGSDDDQGFGIAVDAAGYAYVTGYTASAEFPRTVGLAHSGSKDVFVLKINALDEFPWILFYPAIIKRSR